MFVQYLVLKQLSKDSFSPCKRCITSHFRGRSYTPFFLREEIYSLENDRIFHVEFTATFHYHHLLLTSPTWTLMRLFVHITVIDYILKLSSPAAATNRIHVYNRMFMYTFSVSIPPLDYKSFVLRVHLSLLVNRYLKYVWNIRYHEKGQYDCCNRKKKTFFLCIYHKCVYLVTKASIFLLIISSHFLTIFQELT